MTTIFYLLAYFAFAAFFALACCKIRGYLAASPLHVRWEIYPVPHEGKKAAYGGSFMENSDWWTKVRHVEHFYDILGIFKEVLLLEATFKHNHTLWFRTYPFHFGLYMLMGGSIILFFTVLAGLLGASPLWNPQEMEGFVTFIHNVLNSVVLIGALAIFGGGIALICRRMNDEGLAVYSSREHFLNIGVFVLFAFLTLMTWACNADYVILAATFMHNLLTLNFVPQESNLFALSMLLGFFVLLWIPLSNMQHLLLKYFMYHDIRWNDVPTQASVTNQNLIPDLLKKQVTWAAPHIAGDGTPKSWLDVAVNVPNKTEK
ncbi:MAG: nitrate reductase [Desulfovibrio sp.]|nr:nitrate reductase [Desulfovibrio sp.]